MAINGPVVSFDTAFAGRVNKEDLNRMQGVQSFKDKPFDTPSEFLIWDKTNPTFKYYYPPLERIEALLSHLTDNELLEVLHNANKIESLAEQVLLKRKLNGK